MVDLSQSKNQVEFVTNFQELIAKDFDRETNAIGFKRKLKGDFSELVNQIELKENILELKENDLLKLQLSKEGQIARSIILNDIELLKELGASPVLNLIKHYERDDAIPFFPTDVYSFHVDRSPIPTDTFLCTYYGESSDIIPNYQAIQKIHIPEIRNKLKKIYSGTEDEFDSFLNEFFFDLHYQAKSTLAPYRLGVGNLWKLAVDYPGSIASPCIHRAPKEVSGQKRLLLIC